MPYALFEWDIFSLQIDKPYGDLAVVVLVDPNRIDSHGIIQLSRWWCPLRCLV